MSDLLLDRPGLLGPPTNCTSALAPLPSPSLSKRRGTSAAPLIQAIARHITPNQRGRGRTTRRYKFQRGWQF